MALEQARRWQMQSSRKNRPRAMEACSRWRKSQEKTMHFLTDENRVYLMNVKRKVRRANNFDGNVKLTEVNAGP